MVDKEKDFYEKLDFEKRSNSGMSCFKFALVMFFILLIGEATLFYIGRNISSETISSGTSPAREADISIVEHDQVGEIIVTESVLCSKIKEIRDLETSNISCSIGEDGVVISGKIGSLLPQNGQATIMPEISEGRVTGRLTKLTIGKIPVPLWMAPTIPDALSNAIDTEGADIKRIDLKDGIMVFVIDTSSQDNSTQNE